MAGKSEKIMLLSTGKTKDGRDTGYFYTVTKSRGIKGEKLERKKFDPRAWDAEKNRCGMHVPFKEKRIPK